MMQQFFGLEEILKLGLGNFIRELLVKDVSKNDFSTMGKIRFSNIGSFCTRRLAPVNDLSKYICRKANSLGAVKIWAWI